MTAAKHSKTETTSAFARDISGFLNSGAIRHEEVVQVWPLLEEALPGVLENFYKGILATPYLAAKMGDKAKDTSGLVKAQTAHWKHIFTHEPDLEFESQAAKIGAAHVRIGLTGPWLMAAFGRLISDAIPQIVKANRLSPKRATRLLQAMVNRFFLDMILAQRAFEEGMMLNQKNAEEAEKNLSSLRNIADTVCEINELSMAMAILSRNSRDANQNSQAISAAAEELVRSIQEISQNSEEANREASATNEATREGLDRMAAVSGAIEEIASTSSLTSESLQELHEASGQIGEFLAVIESIANQTNLLALNATIEAARAGEAGKGFAVVAAEVKSLATQTAKATEDISRRIEALQAGMTTIQNAITSSHTAVGKGQDAMLAANTLMQSIGGQISTVTERITDISSILYQQKDTSQEIARSISQVAEMAHDNDDRLATMNRTLQSSNDSFSENASRWFSPDSTRSICEMAKIDHVLFKKRVVDTITGRGDWRANDVPNHHGCRLGKWYDSIQNAEIRAHSSFRAMEKPHQQVHELARKALQAHEANDMVNAFQILSELESASQAVISSLNAFSKALDGELASADKRGFARQAGDGKARIEGQNGARDLEVTDVSRTGIGLKGVTRSDVGKAMQIDYAGKRHIGEAVWSDGQSGGVRFLSSRED